MKNLLLNTLFSKTDKDFINNLTSLLISRDFPPFTIWNVANGILCSPVSNFHGISEGTFDIYDLGYDGSQSYTGSLSISYFEQSHNLAASFFFYGGDQIRFALSFHKPLADDSHSWLKALTPFINMRVEELYAKEHGLEMFVDYQRKINFIKESGQILQVLKTDEVVVNAFNYFAGVFSAEAGCAIYNDQFVGFGINAEDLSNSFTIGGVPLNKYLININKTEFIDKKIESPKFSVLNIYIVVEPISRAIFLLFNIMVDKVPDEEFSALISHIVSIAIENARYHERITKFMVEEAEMSQTVNILNQFVKREMRLDNPELFAVNYPARSTGGDFVTIIEKDDKIFICVTDVCGKGYSAAVFTVVLATMINPIAINDLEDLPGIITGINKYMLSKDFDNRFITGFFCVYDRSLSELSYVGCGHEPAYLLKADGTTTQLMSEYLPMGLVAESYTQKKVCINDGESLFIYTDGVVEYISYDDLSSELLALRNKSPQAVVTKLYKELVKNPEQQRDDFTCVAIKF